MQERIARKEAERAENARRKLQQQERAAREEAKRTRKREEQERIAKEQKEMQERKEMHEKRERELVAQQQQQKQEAMNLPTEVGRIVENVLAEDDESFDDDDDDTSPLFDSVWAAQDTATVRPDRLDAQLQSGHHTSGLSFEGGGFVFQCTSQTEKECLRRGLLGLPGSLMPSVQRLTPDTPIFLHNFKTKRLFGVFSLQGKPGYNLEKEAWEGRFPAQARVNLVLPPMAEEPMYKQRIDSCQTSPQLLRSLMHTLGLEEYMISPPLPPAREVPLPAPGFSAQTSVGWPAGWNPFAPAEDPWVSMEKVDDSHDTRCVVCLDREDSHLIVPCGHQCLCVICAQLYLIGSNCPICRAPVQAVVKVHRGGVPEPPGSGW